MFHFPALNALAAVTKKPHYFHQLKWTRRRLIHEAPAALTEENLCPPKHMARHLGHA